jgi:hypothetical protein
LKKGNALAGATVEVDSDICDTLPFDIKPSTTYTVTCATPLTGEYV